MLHVDFVALGDYCVIESGFAFKSDKFTNAPDDICLVKGSNLGHLSIDWINGPKWPSNDYEKLKRYELVPGDIVIAMDRPIVGDNLKFAWIQETAPKALLVQRVARLRGKNGLDQKYLKCVVADPSFQSYIDTITTGVNVPHISGPDMRRYKFPLPPLPTQQKIACILSAYDDLIENNLKRIKLLEEMARLTYEEWFVRLKFPGHEQAMFDPETELPEGWKEEKIRNTDIKLIDGDRGNNYPKQNDYHEKEYCLFLNTGNVTLNGFDFNNCNFITKEKDSILRKGKIEYCDIILTTRGTIGNVAFYKEGIPFENIRINSGMLIVRSKKEVLPNYLYQTFISKGLKHQMQVFSYGAAQPQLPVGTLNNIKILVPKVQIQQEFSRIIEINIKTTNILRYQNKNLKEARDILLPRLMTGMIDVESLELPETVANKSSPRYQRITGREASIHEQ